MKCSVSICCCDPVAPIAWERAIRNEDEDRAIHPLTIRIHDRAFQYCAPKADESIQLQIRTSDVESIGHPTTPALGQLSAVGVRRQIGEFHRVLSAPDPIVAKCAIRRSFQFEW